MADITRMTDVIRHMALADPQRAFDVIGQMYNLAPSRPQYEPVMIDYDGDEVSAHTARSCLVDEGQVTIAEYPQGTTTASIGSDHMTVVRREWRGKEALVSHYVFDERLERFRATGAFGEIEDMDPWSFMELLREHRVLEEFSLEPKAPDDDGYVAFLREHGASANVIDG